MKIWGRTLVLATGMLLLSVGAGPVWGEAPQQSGTTTEIPAEMKEPPPTKPVEPPPGYAPSIPAATPYGTLELGPSSGYLAPYGNPTAYDSLLRGWRSHRLGKALVTPFLEADGLYNSNIYLTPTNKLGDFIFVLSPGLRVEVPIAGRHRFSVGYLGSGFIYTTYGANSHYDQNVNVDMTFNLKGGLSLRFGNFVRLATEERNSEFSTMRRYVRETPYFVVAYAFADRWRLEGIYQFDLLHFTNNAYSVNNYNLQNMGVTLYYRFLPKTAALVQYIFTYKDYPSSSVDNVYSHTPLVGLTWDPTAKLSGTVKFGTTFQNYETHVAGRSNSPESFAMSLNLLYRFSKVTNFSVTAQRGFYQDVDFGNSDYRSTGVWLALNHEWSYFRVSSYASFFYIKNDYVNATPDTTGQVERRHDDIVGVGVGLSRPITRWLRVRADYSYSNRSSDFAGYGYNNHKVLFGLQTSL